MSGSKARAVVADALQAAWDDFVADTGCFPDCFELHDGKRGTKLFAEFDRGNFHRFVTDWLVARGVDFDRASLDVPRPRPSAPSSYLQGSE